MAIINTDVISCVKKKEYEKENSAFTKDLKSIAHYGWIRLCSHCCRGYHFIFIVHWT